jgi:RimJ/RimL family protein N-acetyltransferase
VNSYKILPSHPIVSGEIELAAVQLGEIEKIRQWRNQQMNVLRQSKEISREDQVRYFENKVWQDLESSTPNQILLSIYKNEVHIGYGGLVHISWENFRAEISFLLDTSLGEESETYTKVFDNFLEAIEKISRDALKIHRLHLETYSFRDKHLNVIEARGFSHEGTLIDHNFIDDRWFNSILHGKILK